MAWSLSFISEEEFKNHVRATIMKYGEKLESYDLKRFNSNLIDPIKLIFDKSVYHTSWQEIVNNEIFRQRDKSNNNDIGYFHQNIKWTTKVDGKSVQHRLIRRVSMDQFYAILTGEEDAFFKMCMALPTVINSVVNEEGSVSIPHDTVIDELRKVAEVYSEQTEDLAMAVYMLGFHTYMGFGNKMEQQLGRACGNAGMLKRIYEYAKRSE